MVALRPDIIVATGLASNDLKELNNTILVVLTATPEVVGLRVMNSRDHPGGNVTGAVARSDRRSAKELALLKEVVPRLIR